MIDFHQTYVDNHFMMYVSQIIMLYLNYTVLSVNYISIKLEEKNKHMYLLMNIWASLSLRI